MIPSCFFVFWHSLHIFSPIANIESVKWEATSPLCPSPFTISPSVCGKYMDHVAALQKQSLLVHSCSRFLSQGACWTKEPTEERLHTSETMFSAPQRLCTFWKGSHYYSAGDFKRFPSSFWCSLMHSHAQLSELQNHWVCLYNQSPANPHDYRNGTLAHTLSSWQSDTVSPSPPALHPFPPSL